MPTRRGFLASLSLPMAASLARVVPPQPRVLSGVIEGRSFYSLRGFVLAPGAVIRDCIFRGWPGPSGALIDATAWVRSRLPGMFTRNTILGQ